MKKEFLGYYRPTEAEFKALWQEGVFILDANVLLNLYSYPEDIREVFFSVLEKLKQRLWIPYHVGLEFHRNRLNRIQQANQRVEKLLQTILTIDNQLNEEVSKIELEKRNIGVTDIQDRLKAVKDAHAKLSEAVSLACEKLPKVSLEDSIGDRVSALLENKVGNPPENQEALNELVADASERYNKKVPPGFMDIDKSDESYRDRGIDYQRKHGDLILWKQCLIHLKTAGVKRAVFVTGDRKRDWWWIEDGKTIGPHAGIIQEALLFSGLDAFWMYSSDQFLEFAKGYLNEASVTKEAIEQVKDIATETFELNQDYIDFFKRVSKRNTRSIYELIRSKSSEEQQKFLDLVSERHIIERWLKHLFYKVEFHVASNMFIAQDGAENNLHGFKAGEISIAKDLASTINSIVSADNNAKGPNEFNLKSLHYIFIVPRIVHQAYSVESFRRELLQTTRLHIAKHNITSIILGYIEGNEFKFIDNISNFIPNSDG
ncbi:MAG: DUF4935 domain-containing protein [Ferrovibrio sp.]|nr:DUF4935 domain-containing protein [Ferrovibrio sp.]